MTVRVRTRGSPVSQWRLSRRSVGGTKGRVVALMSMSLLLLAACGSTADVHGHAFDSTPASVSTTGGVGPGTATATAFTLTSPAMTEGGTLPVQFTCDGAAETPPLTWHGAPAGTVGYAVVMYSLPPSGGEHWYWVLYDIAPAIDHLDANAAPPASVGTNSVNGRVGYAPPCSKGPGPKLYTFTVYALSGRPDLPNPAAVSRPVLLDALEGLILGEAHLDVTYTRRGSGIPTRPAAPPTPTQDYGYVHGDVISSSGHLRVTATPEQVRVDYVRAYLPDDEQPGRPNGQVAYSHTIWNGCRISLPACPALRPPRRPTAMLVGPASGAT